VDILVRNFPSCSDGGSFKISRISFFSVVVNTVELVKTFERGGTDNLELSRLGWGVCGLEFKETPVFGMAPVVLGNI